jgi:hypothetical protein
VADDPTGATHALGRAERSADWDQRPATRRPSRESQLAGTPHLSPASATRRISRAGGGLACCDERRPLNDLSYNCRA